MWGGERLATFPTVAAARFARLWTLHYHARMEDRATEIRNAFRESALQLVDVLERVPSDAWEKPGLGEWTVRELVAHVLKIFDGPVTSEEQDRPLAADSAAAYYVLAMSSPRIHEEVAERARESAASIGDDPAEAVRAIVARSLEAVACLGDDAPVSTTVGAIRLVDYLPTRVVEIVIHAQDVAEAAGVSFEPSHDALTVSLALLGEIAVEHGDGAALAMALSGRRSLPEGFNVLG